MRVWYRDCALAFQAKEVSLSLTIRSITQFGYHLTTKELIMNIKTFMAAAVIALTAACTPSEETPTVSEAAGPAADEALAAAEAVEPAAEPALGENEKPK
jgi:hypothetical protein